MAIEPDRDLGRSLDSAESELERQMLLSIYNGKAQRRQRRWANTGLVIKHTLRGLAFSWPLYMLGFAAFALPGRYSWLLSLLLLPAVWVSGRILLTGLREESAAFLHRRILKPGAVKQMLTGRSID